MAEEETTEEEAKPKKKGGIMPLILVAVGAGLGGAGVVFMSPKPEVEKPKGPPAPVYEHVEHPDKFEINFNPRTDRGRASGQVYFQFVYKMNKHDEAKVLEAIKTNWTRVNSRCLVIFSSKSVKDLMTPQGKQDLKKQLVDELTLTFFPEGEAEVDDILWVKFMVQ